MATAMATAGFSGVVATVAADDATVLCIVGARVRN